MDFSKLIISLIGVVANFLDLDQNKYLANYIAFVATHDHSIQKDYAYSGRCKLTR